MAIKNTKLLYLRPIGAMEWCLMIRLALHWSVVYRTYWMMRRRVGGRCLTPRLSSTDSQEKESDGLRPANHSLIRSAVPMFLGLYLYPTPTSTSTPTPNPTQTPTSTSTSIPTPSSTPTPTPTSTPFFGLLITCYVSSFTLHPSPFSLLLYLPTSLHISPVLSIPPLTYPNIRVLYCRFTASSETCSSPLVSSPTRDPSIRNSVTSCWRPGAKRWQARRFHSPMTLTSSRCWWITRRLPSGIWRDCQTTNCLYRTVSLSLKLRGGTTPNIPRNSWFRDMVQKCFFLQIPTANRSADAGQDLDQEPREGQRAADNLSQSQVLQKSPRGLPQPWTPPHHWRCGRRARSSSG